MKNLFFLFLVVLISTGQAQVIHLEKAEVNYSPKALIVSSGTDGIVMKIPEMYKGQFSENPILFMKENFNIKSFIERSKDENYNFYIVNFRSSNGHLRVVFNENGDLEGNSQKFENVRLPITMSKDILRNYKGWEVKSNLYVASGKGDLIQKEFYKVKLSNGKDVKTLKIKPVTVTLANN